MAMAQLTDVPIGFSGLHLRDDQFIDGLNDADGGVWQGRGVGLSERSRNLGTGSEKGTGQPAEGIGGIGRSLADV